MVQQLKLFPARGRCVSNNADLKIDFGTVLRSGTYGGDKKRLLPDQKLDIKSIDPRVDMLVGNVNTGQVCIHLQQFCK